MSRRSRALGGASGMTLALALAAWPLGAMGQTTILPDQSVTAALGTTVTQGGTVFAIEGGTLSGPNLFHSFSQFSLGAGDTARWTRLGGDAPSVSNVINRVTGGDVSRIAGTLDSTGLPNANFFFINPAGIVFSQGARINVPAAAFFSTAGDLRFTDGARFAVTAPDGSTLSMAMPESFGFLGGQGSIEVTRVGADFAPSTALLSFSGADVRISNPNLDLAQRTVVRGLDLIGVGTDAQVVDLSNPLTATGTVQVRNSAFVITSVDSAAGAFRIRGGQVDLDSVDVISDTGGLKRGGDIRIVADQLRISGGSSIGTSARSQGAAGDIDFEATDVDINGGTLFSVSTTGAAAGRIALSADNLVVRGGATLASTNSAGGRGGDIALTAQTLLLDSVDVISSALGIGRGGDIIFDAPAMQLRNTNAIATSLGLARPGDIHIDGGVIEFSGGSYGSAPGANSDSGAVTINAASSLYALGASFLASSSSDNGAGSITIRGPEVLLVESRISADNFGDGGGGMVLVEADTLVFEEAAVRVEAYGAAGDRPGLVRLKATGDIQFFNSDVSSNTNGQAGGGIIEIAGGDIQLNDSRVVSDTVGLAQGDAGRVAIMANNTLLVRNGVVSSGSNSFGNGGDVVLEAQTITLDVNAKVRADTIGFGDAGQVDITAAGSLTVVDTASITSLSEGATGRAGTVSIKADTLTLTDGQISSSTEGQGDAGQVFIKAGKIVLDGERRKFTSITSDTVGEGNAGGVLIEAGSLDVRNRAYISSDTGANGHAGSVNIRADALTITDGGYISSDSTGRGDAGDISIVAGDLKVIGNGDDITFISSDSLGTGSAGTVTIEAKTLLADVGGFISSDTYTLGDAGDIIVKADTISLKNNGNIRSRTLSNGAAGDVSITAGTLSLDSGAGISSEATDTSLGNAGFIGIVADSLKISDQARVSTSTSGEGDAGKLTISAKTLVLDGGLISSASERGSAGASGALRVEAETLSVVNRGTISTVSHNPLPAGRIEITAGTLSVDGGRTLISSENLAGDVTRGGVAGEVGDAGSVNITAANLTVSNGGQITTNSFGAAAGDIVIRVPRPGLLVLEGTNDVGSIQTSSGPGTGGKITITDPLAIVSNGGSILALGQLSGANVTIQSRYFINSTDRPNTVAVDGEVRLETGLYDVSSGTVNREISVLDASKVLQGQCPAARSTGAVSQLITRPVGPHVRQTGFAMPPPRTGPAPAGAGACS